MIALAAELNIPVGIWLLRKGVRAAGFVLENGLKSWPAGFTKPTFGPLVKVQIPLPLNAAVVFAGTFCAHKDEKSPPLSARGTVCNWVVVGCEKRDPEKSAKKNNLPFAIGPPIVPPKLSQCNPGRAMPFALLVQLLAPQPPRRANSYNEP